MARRGPATLDDVRRGARRRLPRLAFDFIDGGADDEITLARNLEAFRRRTLRPRALVDVSTRDLGTTVLGDRYAMPVLIAPTGMSRLAGPAGDVAGARAAGRMGTGFTLSTMSSHSIEEVARNASGPLWFQLYLWPQREIVDRLVARAKAAGYRALVVTVDVPVVGNRVRDVRNGFAFPPRPSPRTAVDMLRHPRWLASVPSAIRFANVVDESGTHPTKAVEYAKLVNRLLVNPGADWGELRRLREVWDGPLVVKGVLTGADAAAAVDCGADGIIVSNHGGRQLDGAPAALDALAEVVASVPEGVEVLMDGGVRRGSDVVKAIALGARGCLIGRPWLFGLACGGEDGVAAVLGILRAELDRTLALVGRPALGALDAEVVGDDPFTPGPAPRRRPGASRA